MRVGHRRETTVTKLLPFTMTRIWLHGNLKDSLLSLCRVQEAELIASVWGNRLALSLYGQLMEMMLDKPTYITYCDNAAVVQLTQQLSASKTRTRHLSMRASWLHHFWCRERTFRCNLFPRLIRRQIFSRRDFKHIRMNLPERVFDYAFVMVYE